MLTSISDQNELAGVRAKMERIFKKQATAKFHCRLGHPGGVVEELVYWFEPYGFWGALTIADGSRYWNAFGTMLPREGADLNITVEINFPLAGQSKQIAGVATRDHAGRTYLAHRGRIGGGRPGVGPAAFREYFPGEYEVLDNHEPVALIGQLEDPGFLRHLGTFVHQVERIKEIAVGRQPVVVVEDEPGPEFTGEKPSISQQILAKCDHGLVVYQLALQLRDRGQQVGNDRLRDLFVVGPGGQPSVLLEVKTDLDTGSIYGAVGQLLYHAAASSVRPRLVAVLPEAVAPEVVVRLARLGVEVLPYALREDAAGVEFGWGSSAAFLNDRR